jgi:hypothetical protein
VQHGRGIVATDEGLGPWIRDLRGRVARGDLITLPPVDLGYGTGNMPADLTIRIMLADLDDLDDPEGSSRDGHGADHEARRRALLDDFMRLRELLG